jgi:hypothetical protein
MGAGAGAGEGEIKKGLVKLCTLLGRGIGGFARSGEGSGGGHW